MADENPSQISGLRGLTDPVAFVAFGGWNDAGSAASQTVEHLAETCNTSQAFSLDPDDFYDYQVNRPEVRGRGETRRIAWPTTEIRVGKLPNGRDLVIIQGLEPNFRWRQFCQLLTSALRSAGVQRVYLIGALLADHPHTRPIPVSASSGNPTVTEELGLEANTYEGPTGILGILNDHLDKVGIETVSLWAAIPHYVSSPPSPKGTLALLNRLEDLLDLSLDLGDLPELARAWERGVNELAADDTEVAEYVEALEQQRDESELPEASGDAIAAEFERYLRRRRQQ
jgi:hypothetical protein